MKLVWDRDERVVRNVDEDCPGIVGLGQREDRSIAWSVNGSWQPPSEVIRVTPGIAVIDMSADAKSFLAKSTFFAPAEVVESVEDPDLLLHLFHLAQAALAAVCGQAIERGIPALVRAVGDFLEEQIEATEAQLTELGQQPS